MEVEKMLRMVFQDPLMLLVTERYNFILECVLILTSFPLS